MLTFLAQPIIYFIHFIHSFTGSYAVSVIGITIAVRLILMPLFIQSAKHQKRSKELMSAIKPELDALTTKYKNSQNESEKIIVQQKMQALTSDSLKSSLLGCLPIIVQLPVLFSLYYVIKLDTVIASENFLWMNLGTIDIGISIIACLIYLMQSVFSLEKSQPLNMKIMVFINPIMILIFSLFNPAIIPIYWTVSAILLIVQQLIIKKWYR
ncbi:membrane protein insertase YidC [Lysinibacillus sp. F5]|uniref:YidC/Oxa1 family membrane protein insertase n=1 Tax=Lysinibacillus sp. F5 TaxID=1700846 RepID=UPI000738AE81|nr:membrane protein insertase YidC [Lysinibacillus sp. F5]KUF32847.1 OxaA precursor [Lysinibacillus sp. F5]